MPATNGASGSAAHNCGEATRHHPIRHPQSWGMIRASGRRGKVKSSALTPPQDRAFWIDLGDYPVALERPVAPN